MKKEPTDEELQTIADFDFHMGAMNSFMRKIRQGKISGQIPPLMNAFVVDVATNIAPLIGHPATHYSSLLRMYAEAVQRLANTVSACEQTHPGEQCGLGMLCLSELVNSLTISTHAIATGLEIKRGRPMQLEEEEEV